MKKLLIIKTGSTIPFLAKTQGDFESRILDVMEVGSREVIISDLQSGDSLPPWDKVSGAVITGSHDMVTDHHKWSEEAALWIRKALDLSIPLLGICYGHQLLAYCAGGSVGNNPRGREFGTTAITLLKDACDDPLLMNLPERFMAHVSHTQSVLKLPENARVLAHSKADPHQVFRIGNNAYGVQFHPEFNAAYTREYVSTFADLLKEEGQDPDRILEQIKETADASSILKDFHKLFCSGTDR